MPSRSYSNGAMRTTGNLFLDALAPETLERLRPQLERVQLRAGEVVAPPNVPIAHVFFPIGSVISTITRMSDGTAVEAALTGREGIVGAWLALYQMSTAQESVVQIADSAWRMNADRFLLELRADPSLNEALLRYTHAGIIIAGQFIACNRLHEIQERYARWLLMAHDRVESDHFYLTQEYAGQMLGVRRVSVTLVAGEFARAGLISYRRGAVTILNRAGLEDIACECYGAVNDTLQALQGYTTRKGAVRLASSA
jgi:CRP-like cAMP-binding protein